MNNVTLKFIVVLTAIIAIILAVIINEDCPEELGLSQPWIVKTFLAAGTFAGKIKKLQMLLGVSEHIAMRTSLEIPTYILPMYYGSDPETRIREDVYDGVPVYIYEPLTTKPGRRGVVYYHGGGWTISYIGKFHAELIRIRKYLDAVLIFPVYRLAPEHPFPAAFDDCFAVTKYVLRNAAQLGIDKNRVTAMGDSAGGNLVAAVTYNLKAEKFEPMPKLQVMIYPVLQAEDLDTPSYQYNKNGIKLSLYSMAFFHSAYLIGGDKYQEYIPFLLNNNHTTSRVKQENARSYLSVDILPQDKLLYNYKAEHSHGDEKVWKQLKDKMRDPRFTPLYEKDLSGLPKAYVTSCQFDVLRDEAFFYVKRLREAGVSVEHVNLPCFHCWTQMQGYVNSVDRDYNEMLNYIDNNL